MRWKLCGLFVLFACAQGPTQKNKPPSRGLKHGTENGRSWEVVKCGVPPDECAALPSLIKGIYPYYIRQTPHNAENTPCDRSGPIHLLQPALRSSLEAVSWLVVALLGDDDNTDAYDTWMQGLTHTERVWAGHHLLASMDMLAQHPKPLPSSFTTKTLRVVLADVRAELATGGCALSEKEHQHWETQGWVAPSPPPRWDHEQVALALNNAMKNGNHASVSATYHVLQTQAPSRSVVDGGNDNTLDLRLGLWPSLARLYRWKRCIVRELLHHGDSLDQATLFDISSTASIKQVQAINPAKISMVHSWHNYDVGVLLASMTLRGKDTEIENAPGSGVPASIETRADHGPRAIFARVRDYNEWAIKSSKATGVIPKHRAPHYTEKDFGQGDERIRINIRSFFYAPGMALW